MRDSESPIPAAQPLPPSGYAILDARYVFGLDFRPTGTRALDLGIEVKYLQGDNVALPRGIVSLDIPGLGRARGDVEVMNLPTDATRAIVGTAGLEIYLGHASLGGGIVTGNGLGPNNAVGEYLTASPLPSRR